MEPETVKQETTLNVYLDKMLVVQPSELEHISTYNYFDEETPCQVYFVCRRPIITVDVSSFGVTKDKLELTFCIGSEGNRRFHFSFENPFQTNALSIEAQPPYTLFSILKNGEPVINLKASTFLQSFPQELTHADFLDLEILYIGQTYDGTAHAGHNLSILRKHKTINDAYTTATAENPAHEICLLLASFREHDLIKPDGRKGPTADVRLADMLGLSAKGARKEQISNRQMLNMTEAALIRYFEPPYNDAYKNVFHNPAIETYDQCYDLNIYSIGIELDTYHIANCHIYSGNVEPKWLHMKTYVFQSPEERKALFSPFYPNVAL